MDLSLSDALNSKLPPQSESLVQKDFIATLEAQSFEDKVRETVGKTEYSPLRDMDGKGDEFPQTGMLVNMDVGVAPHQVAKPPGVPQPQTTTLPLSPKPLMQPQSMQDAPGGPIGASLDGVGQPTADLSLSPSTESSPGSYQENVLTREDREGDRKQQRKKKKRRTKEEICDVGEDWGPEQWNQGEDTFPFDSPDQSPLRGAGWQCEEGGRGGVRVKKGKVRKKIPDVWDIFPESSLPSAATVPKIDPAGLTLNSSLQTMESPSHVAMETLDTVLLNAEEELSSDTPPSPTKDLPNLSPGSHSANKAASSPKQTTNQDSVFPESLLINAGEPSQLRHQDDDTFLLLPGVSTDAIAQPVKQDCHPIPTSPQPESAVNAITAAAENTSSVSTVKPPPSDGPALISMPSHPAVSPVSSPVPPQALPVMEETAPMSSKVLTAGVTVDPNNALALSCEVALAPEDDPFKLPHHQEPPPPSVPSPMSPAQSTPSPKKSSRKKSSTSPKSPGPTIPVPTPASPVTPSVTSTSRSPPLVTAASTPAPATPVVSSGLNPSAPPFFPNSVEYHQSHLQDCDQKQGQAGPFVLEVKSQKTDESERTEKTDNSLNVKNVDLGEMTDKPEEVEKMETSESDVNGKSDNVENRETMDQTVKADKMSDEDKKVDKTDKIDTDQEKTQKTEKVEKGKDKIHKVEKTAKDKKIDKVQKVEKDKNTKKVEKIDCIDKKDKQEKTNKVGKVKARAQENGEKVGKVEKLERTDKAPKKTMANRSSAPPNKGLIAADRKTKPAAGPTKPSSVKTRPNPLPAGDSAPDGPTPVPTSSGTVSKKSPVRKVSEPTASTKRPPPTASRTPSITQSREPKPKSTEARRPPVPKANAALPTRTATPKISSATLAAPKPATRTSSGVSSLKRTAVTKTESKAEEVKKPSTLRTATDSSRNGPGSTRKSPTTPSTPTASAHSTKPPTPTATLPERKPPVPRAPRSSTNPRPSTAPTPDIKNVRSKIGSTDNMKHQPGGGKVSTSQGTTDTLAKGPLSKETSQGKVQIVTKKLDFSHITSRCGSKDNIKHVPGGGNIQILNKKVDLSKVTSKCGSKANMKHKPGGGDVKIESHKISVKAQSKVGSMDNMNHNPGGGNFKAEGMQETTEGNGAPCIGGTAQETGLLEAVSCGGEGLRDPQVLDTRIPETN
ncbi:microtubule-associated protein 4-like isoform X3 [Brienomyrus brachyistius]|uniref:microtubule-associated protein 4-like isoform X3 n=1 Tax=Brienomyrus brachyistius TaxID=42636 RepID=UPI0020B302CE|nr:microtubule-associated protein 4-like isoform X3 [Brienomyrus brachyistius]